MQSNESSQTDNVGRFLPWILFGITLIIYGATLNPWVTMDSLPWVAKVTGWDWWSLSLRAPVFFLLTLPFQWLPADWTPVLLNGLAALCAAGALGLLGRCVMLLPHDRTRDQRHREHSEYSLLSISTAWIPPVLAVLACGLQFTLWRHATMITSESLNLLLFAYCVRCLLEYRIEARESWLYKLAFVYGVAVTNNWAMLGFFPLFMGALIWIKGVRCFQLDFFLRMLGLGCAGLLLYLALPLIDMRGGKTDYSFWLMVKSHLVWQRNLLLAFPRPVAGLCGLTSILPVLVMGIRWPSTIGDLSVLSNLVTNIMFRVVHILFWVVCLWVMFDPPFSPRARGFGFPMLPFYFLSALAIGYYSGYFLLVFGKAPAGRRHQESIWERLLNPLFVVAVWLALVAVPVGLAYRNYSLIRAANEPLLRRLAENFLRCLPAKSCFVLSDDQNALLMLEAVQAKRPASEHHICLDTTSLPYRSFERLVARRCGNVWPVPLTSLDENAPFALPSPVMNQIMLSLVKSNEVYYLHPSFGYYFEVVRPQPRGLVYRLTPFAPGQVDLPAPTTEDVAANAAFWTQTQPEQTWFSKLDRTLIKDRSLREPAYVAAYYSRAANYWGYRLQQSNQWLNEAANAFQWALAFNPDNDCASLNLELNRWLKAGAKGHFKPPETFENQLRQKYRTWENLLLVNGPCDGAAYSARLGEVYASGSPELCRQAAHLFIRASALDPTNTDYSLWLGNLFLKLRQADLTLDTLQKLKAPIVAASLSLTNQLDVVRMESLALTLKSNYTTAISNLAAAALKFPKEKTVPETLVLIYMRMHDYTNALAAVDQVLRLDPTDKQALLNKSAFHIHLQQFQQAIPPLNQLLGISPNHTEARLNRAIAYLQSGQLEPARQDYEAFLKLAPDNYRGFYGLGEIAFRQNRLPTAIQCYEKYLEHAPQEGNRPVDPVEFQFASNRLNELKIKAGAPGKP
jgi:tetratricopeptide (TPR) repeat protein